MKIAPLLPPGMEVSYPDDSDAALTVVFHNRHDRERFLHNYYRLSSPQLTFEQLMMIANCDGVTEDKLAAPEPDDVLKAYVQGAIDSALTGLHRAMDELKATAAAKIGEPSVTVASATDRPVYSTECKREPCMKAPLGWYCTRERGHDGPCAAEPERTDGAAPPLPLARPGRWRDGDDGSSHE